MESVILTGKNVYKATANRIERLEGLILKTIFVTSSVRNVRNVEFEIVF